MFIAWVRQVVHDCDNRSEPQYLSYPNIGWGLDDVYTPSPFLEGEGDYDEVKPVVRAVKPAPPKMANEKCPRKNGFLWGISHVTDLDEICFLE